MNRIASSPARVPSNAIKRRLLVLGCAHAGGGLVRRLLADYPGVHDFGESGVFGELAGRPRRYRPWTLVGASIGRERRMLFGVLDRAYADEPEGAPALPPREPRLRATFAGIVATLDRVALSAGCRSWVEHTPGVARQTGALERMIPGLRLIHVVRDGRDVVASHCTQAAQRRGGRGRNADARQAIDRWNRALAAQARCFGRPGHAFVFYEDLLQSPREELERLAHECGLGLDSEAAAEAVRHVDVAPPRAERSRFRSLFDVERRRRIEASLDLQRYGRLAERLRNHTLRTRRYTPVDTRARPDQGVGPDHGGGMGHDQD